ncbi:hypothetical protein LXL04_014384 [Taraxacum kok-saghyz]
MCVRLRNTMPELAYDSQSTGGDTTTSYSLSSDGSVSSSGFWSKRRDDVSCNQLQKFWSDLSPQARRELLRVDKQTLFEQARKNMFCSRCNGLLLEGYLQIVMYGKSLQQVPNNGCRTLNNRSNEDECDDDIQDPAVHPWGGLTTTRDGTLTLLDCYLYSKSLKGLQNVFGSARARERERELLYPDACGGGGRGWIGQAMVGYGRGHGTRETCALHTARLSVDTLVDFWSALGEETRHCLLKMKEEDFIERLMYRFDSKRFCRDCRKNVIREFKELKELKRMKREPRCTTWFCVADTSFQCQVTRDTIEADWHQTHVDSAGTYEHYEWGVGTAEGKSDIREFENVGLNVRVKVNGLDLEGLTACYITLRAWKKDGRHNELSVKAHGLNGQQCVHCRLIVGDGFVTITRGESIRRFFEHAEEAEEEEDDDSMDNDGNALEGECSRPQKHAKSPELAREFLLDAATVIFKEQVEKAFREGTARQNAHSMFVSLALKLLEQRVFVACKDIITLQKQFKLLEEEEKEKRDEEERKERRKAKEKEKKLRRKERLRSKEKERNHVVPVSSLLENKEEELTNTTDTIKLQCKEEEEEEEETVSSEDYNYIPEEQNRNPDSDSNVSKHPRRTSKWSDRGRLRNNNPQVNGTRSNDRYAPRGCSCYQNDYKPKPEYIRDNNYNTRPKTNRDSQIVKKTWEPMETQKRYTCSYTPPSLKIEPVSPDLSNETTNDLKESKNAQVETAISNSSSDSSSCLSEGDGNTSFSSNTQNLESLSTSDLEDAIKETSLDTKELELPLETEQFYGITDSIPVTQPPLQPQGIHFPVIQPPSAGYYHQGGVPWVAMPMPPPPHQNHYLFPTPFGYNWNGNSQFLQYNPLAPPLHNHGQHPMYQSVPQVKKVIETASPPIKGGQMGNCEKTKGNTGFSLFHFGGPVDISNGSVEIDSGLESGHGCGKEVVEMEEYNLFAASNGIRFSF